jgi:hypothetical protein
MRAFLTGGTGFIGRRLVRALRERDADVVVVSRGGRDPWRDPRVHVVTGDPTRSGSWQAALGGCDVVFNLAGAPIVEPPQRWTTARKAAIRESRVGTTHCVVEALRAAAPQPTTLVSQSAVGYYGSRGNVPLDETAPPGSDFLARLCVEWEEAARAAQDVTRVVLLRTAPVLGQGGGVLAPLLTPFKLGLGGPWGAGTQWWSWVHLDDVVGLALFTLDRAMSGAVNVVAPEAVTVQAFAKALGEALHRPAFARVPEVALRLALGEAAEALLASQRVIPSRALDAGYAFQYPELRAALDAALRR